MSGDKGHLSRNEVKFAEELNVIRGAWLESQSSCAGHVSRRWKSAKIMNANLQIKGPVALAQPNLS